MVGVQDHCSLLDCLASVCAVRADYAEAAIIHIKAIHHRDIGSLGKQNSRIIFSVTLCPCGENDLHGTQRQTRACGWAWSLGGGFCAVSEVPRGAGNGV